MRIATVPDFFRRTFSKPLPRRILRIAGWLAGGVYLAFAVLALVLRYGILPQIENYRGDVAAALSQSLGLPVSIRAIDAGWNGLRPRLGIHGFEIRDKAGRPALGFENVEAELAWSSVWHLGLRLHRLEIVAPDLDIRRDKAGHLFVAGLEMSAASADSGFSDWLLAQDHVVVRNAAVRWHDELRDAPLLDLQKLNFDLQNSGSRHRFGFTAEPPKALAARLDVRGDFKGRDIDVLESWKGDLYAELDYADLAVWRTWVDYPVELPRGSGGLRLWLSFAQMVPTGFTADVRLADVQVRLGPALPMLDLVALDGRLAGQRTAEGIEVVTKQLTLATREGIRVEPTDLRLSYHPAAANRAAWGEIETNGLDLGTLAALAAYLPLDESLRAQLATYAPQGRLLGVKAAWSGVPGAIATWRAKGRFENLGLAAKDARPGFAGISGSIDGNERGGTLALDSRHAAIELPSVFADPRIALDALGVQANWKEEAGGIDVQIVRADFHNEDATGEASGHYRIGAGGGPGVIDLDAKLTKGAGSAVWRYMPLVVNKDARDWLKNSIVGGSADEATLRLKGDLAKFPFKDGREGIFQVKGRFHDATLRYAPSWPELRDVEGELLFEGARMLIQGHKGDILGVAIGPVTAEIPDLESGEELMTISGKAAGATANFLKFVEQSPVGTRIDHFTEDMTAAGNGELDLKLTMPLRHIVDTKVDGHYRFVGNKLSPDPDLPPFTEVNGELHFSADRLDAQKVHAAIFGTPLTVDVATAGDGNVVVKAAGSVAIRSLRQQFDLPLFEHLSGATSWAGTVKVKKKNAEVRIESSLQGIASSLPEPFNKTTNQVLPLVFERKQLPGAGRDEIDANLGQALKLQLMRRHDADKAVVERGLIAIGAAPRLPERGVLLALQAKRVDLDFWRRMAGGGSGGGAGLPLSQLDVQTDELVAFGRSIAGLRLTGVQSGGIWKADIKSRDAAGNLVWDSRGAGRISGHLTQLLLSESTAKNVVAARADMPDEMPAIELAVDRFALGSKEFGALKVKAETAKDGYWNAKFDVRNDDATLEGTGRWRATPTPDTHLDFKLGVTSIEKLLNRIGYPDAIRRGAAKAEGSLSWSGMPTDPDIPSLGGTLKFEASDGQFKKLEPGVGRLLGIISLQSLPRRLTLDFRDIFSEGFAFDSIAGQATSTYGILDLKNLQISGPAAKVLMAGTIDIAAETQDLKVRVQPALGETVATGVLLVHPAAGAAAWVFNKLFGNPLDKAFAYDYIVTGPWIDPKVEKVAGPSKEAAKNVKEGGAQ
jgi:uncharacterized protein (TIGR02099 family)